MKLKSEQTTRPVVVPLVASFRLKYRRLGWAQSISFACGDSSAGWIPGARSHRYDTVLAWRYYRKCFNGNHMRESPHIASEWPGVHRLFVWDREAVTTQSPGLRQPWLAGLP